MVGALNALFSRGFVQFWKPLFHLSYNIELLRIRSDDSCALHIRVGQCQLSEADSMFLDRSFPIEKSALKETASGTEWEPFQPEGKDFADRQTTDKRLEGSDFDT